jgi:hypothetical protein
MELQHPKMMAIDREVPHNAPYIKLISTTIEATTIDNEHHRYNKASASKKP